jgi:predicted flap endonuclease-1-like 5' DNA nuclease
MRSKFKPLIISILLELILSGFTVDLQNAKQFGGLAWWIWLLFIVLLLVVVAFWVWSKSRAQTAELTDRTEVEEPERVGSEPKPSQTESAAPMRPGDFTIIEGIDENISKLLKNNGITTLSELAQTDTGQLETILAEADLTADPHTWPEQARLASEGKWDELEGLQESLKYR